MKQFSYKQCDKAIRKMENFDKVLNKYSSSANFYSKSSLNSNKQNACYSSLLQRQKNLKSKQYEIQNQGDSQIYHNINKNSKRFNLQQFNSNVSALGERHKNIQIKMREDFFKLNKVANTKTKEDSGNYDSAKFEKKQQSSRNFGFKKQKIKEREKSIDQIDNQIKTIMSKYTYQDNNVQNYTSNKSCSKDQQEHLTLKRYDSRIHEQDNSFFLREPQNSLKLTKSISKLCHSKYIKKQRSVSNFQNNFKHSFFDKEIDVISQKIKKVQQKKKKLQIQFQPFSYKSKKMHQIQTQSLQSFKQQDQKCSMDQKLKKLLQNYQTLQSYQTNSQKQIANANQYSTIYFHEANSQQTQNKSQHEIQIESQTKINKPSNIKTEQSKNLQTKIQTTNILKLIKKQNQNQNQNQNQGSTSCNEKVTSRLLNHQKIQQKKTQNKLNKSVILVKEQTVNQLQKLLITLVKQIKLDEELRNQKMYFQYVRNQSKWDMLFTELKKNRTFMSYQTMKKVLASTINQHNPFLKFRKNTQNSTTNKTDRESVANLVKKFISAQNFWNNKVFGSFNQQSLYECRFNEYSLDLQGKNQIVVEDLVRFINMSLSSQYRSRDLVLIFNRCLQDNIESELSFKRFMEVISMKELQIV